MGPLRSASTTCCTDRVFPIFLWLTVCFLSRATARQARVAVRAARSCGAHQPKTIVLLHATKARSHHTETGKLLKLKAMLRREFRDWADFSKNMRWVIVYVQHPDTQLFEKRQRCDRTEVKKNGGETDEECNERQAAHDAEQVFWETEVDQYAVRVVDGLLAALILCLNAK
ncbi:hypothetical protein ERJ75_001087900 [Trypanosoma vivax]|nr:hypothetical protein ERJ75_001479300 [Trypanosoma vivax]KAH8606782.1 hypothetical protein ERJ75_001479100 [Trypanosoma vivax]KAH8610580.1 hypothetical protein ERJ75_001087900 [Trypanosoma vivax]